MNLFNKILVPVDFSRLSEIAVNRAIDTAIRCNSSELHLVCVLDTAAMGYFITPETGLAIDFPLVSEWETSVNEKMGGVENSIKLKCDIKLLSAVLKGNLVHAISDYVIGHAIDLVVLANTNISGIREYLFGSNAQRMTSKITCPVLTVHPIIREEKISKIILPIEDFYPENKLKYATLLAKLFEAEVHLVCLGEKVHSLVFDTYSILNRIVKEFRKEQVSYKIMTTDDKNITDGILKYADQESIDLILINPGEESKLTGKIIESSGGHIVNHTPAAVLSIKKKEQ